MGTWWASGILLTGVLDGQYLYDFGADAIDEHIVGGDNRFARIGNAPGPVHIGMIGQSFGNIFDQFSEPSGSGGIAIGNIVDDLAHVFARLRTPDDVRHYAWRAFFAAMIARSSAMT